MKSSNKKFLSIIVVAIIVVTGSFLWTNTKAGKYPGLLHGNGRIEATEIDISNKLAGRIEQILVNEGDFVTAGQPLAQMQTNVLTAQKNEALAQQQQAVTAEMSAKAQIALRESDKEAAEATVLQRASELDAVERRLARSSVLSKKGAMSVQDFDDDETRMYGAKAALTAAKAQVAVAEAAVEAAKAQAVGAAAAIQAAQATVARIEADIEDCNLTAPRTGRIQYRVAEPGEVLPAGGKILNLVDLSDVYMTFFLPEEAAGKVQMGDDARIILDAAPEYVIPAKISFVASTAQFTPKTVETQAERQKLMFRVKAKIDPQLLRKYIAYVKTGLPGVAWVRVEKDTTWPDALHVKVEQ